MNSKNEENKKVSAQTQNCTKDELLYVQYCDDNDYDDDNVKFHMFHMKMMKAERMKNILACRMDS